MLDITTVKKNKVNLSDYNYQLDIQNRSLLADLSFFEHEVLQEIFFSSSKFSLHKLARNLNCEEDQILPILKKLSTTGLLTIQDDTIQVDKETRKYFEFHMKRFDSDFKPDMEYLQGILRKVPIHVLPTWYAIPRTSNNIFDSIVEKYLSTPHLFQRYLSELQFSNPVVLKIMRDVFASRELKISSSDIITKYNLSRKEFEECMLLLEFSFTCCVIYTKTDDMWIEYISPFHEWKEYLSHIKNTNIPSFDDNSQIEKKRNHEFAFVQDLGKTLEFLSEHAINKDLSQESLKAISQYLDLPLDSPSSNKKSIEYIFHILTKLDVLQLTETTNEKISPTKIAKDFLLLALEKRALYLYRHPTNRILNQNLPLELATEKNIREAEKSIRQVLKKQWVYFEEFMKGAIICFNETNKVTLKKIGKSWKYVIPTYNDKEMTFVQIILFEWLFEAGIVSPGIHMGKECFTVTAFGRLFFEE